ncbi:hypothetical protein COV15_00200 [Candidatus Woesearchaeota archaeon CG10_big_fil_rev_8_21_14_0_10_34_12]|nr:MAG: hypothetical protein COV15_00200 [Candidatus Woesearchaeota archaeon CG10_big_fil_rev_8_21_14_0_10_34_12]
MDLDECYRKNFIRKTKVDSELIKSLVEMSRIKELTVNSAKVDSVNISAYVSMAYDSLREVLEAICISHGYKVTSHICLGELLKTLIDDFDFNEFDRMRYVRNGINYYGTKVDFEQGKEIIKKIFLMKNYLLKKYVRV